MNTKETWIDGTMNSLEGIRRAPADPELFDKIMAQTAKPVKITGRFRPVTFWVAAAAIAILVTMNILGLLYYHKVPTSSQGTPATLATEYFSYLEPIKL